MEDLEKLANDISRLSSQMNQVLERLSSIEEAVTPCEEKTNAKNAQISEIILMLEKSPVGQHPMFAQFMGPLKTILTSR